MKTKVKVLHLLWSGEIGGTEEYVTSLIKQFDLSTYEIYLCFLSKKGAIYNEALKATDNVVYIGMNGGYDLGGFIRLFRYLLREKFDIIHSHSTNVLANIAISSFRKSRKIFTEHVSPGARDAFKKRKLFYRLFSNSYQIVTAISGFVKDKLVENMQINSDKIVVIHNGVREDKFNNLLPPPEDLLNIKQSNKYILGFVGRIAGFKRPDLFIEIAVELIRINKKFIFIMVGDGPELEKCRKKIDDNKIAEYFNLLGFRRDIPNILKLFDALIFTSIGEGFGIVLIEAMAMGIPVFAVNDGAVPEIIRDKHSGILLDTVDPKIIAEQILKVFEDRELIRKIKEQSIEDVRSKFTINICARKIENLYRETLGDARG
jgi:glycosyltransferase involved in cell wall biosynthesis